LYFLDRKGVYRTTGGEPELVSRPLDPLFTGNGISSFCNLSAINQAQLSHKAAMGFVNECLYVAVPTGASTTNDKLLKYDPRDDYWTVFDIPATFISSLKISSVETLLFGYATGSNHIGKVGSAYTDDDGTAIVSRYRSGFNDYGTATEKTANATQLWGTGTPSFAWSSDFGSLDTGQTVTLGTSPAIASGWHRYDKRGTLLSWQVSATSGAWTCHRVVPHLEGPGLASDQTTA
jgi:hypothetical protein